MQFYSTLIAVKALILINVHYLDAFSSGVNKINRRFLLLLRLNVVNINLVKN